MTKKTSEKRTFFQKLLIFSFLIISIQAYSQAPKYKTWLGISYEQKLKIKKFKFKLGLSQGLRINDLQYNTRLSALSEIGVSKKITKFYKLGLSYRISYIGGFKNRIALSNSFKLKLAKKLNLSFRIKYQAEFEDNKAFSQDFREKTSLKWDAHKDIRPYLFGEILFNNTYNYSNFNEYRLGIGIDADHKKKHTFDILLMYVQQINIEEPSRNIVIGLSYGFSK